MRVRLWGTRGSLAAPGPDMVRYGGNTACVELRVSPTTTVILDAGTGIRRLGASLPAEVTRVDILLSHLHMDHLQGLGFFQGLYRDDLDIHVWGPPSNISGIRQRLNRYFSQPLFPVRLADLPARPVLHDVPLDVDGFELPGLRAVAALVCHPGTTLGYRLTDGSATLAYIPDHEPALGSGRVPDRAEWLSGYDIARDADLLIHDAQYTDEEYARRVGWGHSTVAHARAFAAAARVGRLVAFHHDPDHTDTDLDEMFADARPDAVPCVPAVEGDSFDVGPTTAPGRDAAGQSRRA